MQKSQKNGIFSGNPYLRPNPDYQKNIGLKKPKTAENGYTIDLTEPEENKKAIEELNKEFRNFIKQPKITKKNVLEYLESVIDVLNQKEDF